MAEPSDAPVAATPAPLGAQEEGARPPVIEVEHLTKRFGEQVAVDDISFSVAPGEVFALLGPNGAGKSTAIKMLCTLALPTSGRAQVAGFDVAEDPKAVRRHIGLVFQEQTLDDQLTAEENLRFHAVLYQVPREQRQARLDRVLEQVALTARRHDLVANFSGGMARRLEIARAMLHTPAILFLDEPTLGLDPQTRTLMWEDVLAMGREEGTTVLLTTHYMEEAEVADRIAIIDHGRIVALDSPSNLKAVIGEDTVELRTDDDARSLAALRAAGYRAVSGRDHLTVFAHNGEDEVARMLAMVGGGVESVHLHRPTLDDVFLHFTGREIREQGGSATSSSMARAWRRR
jgi:ABC-2 type transport system ATP-binding protein